MSFGAIYPAVGNAVPYLFLNHGKTFDRSLLASHVPNLELDATRGVSPCTRCHKLGKECIRSQNDAMSVTGSKQEERSLGLASGTNPEIYPDDETKVSLPVRTFNHPTPTSIDFQVPSARETHDNHSGMDASSDVWTAPASVNGWTQTHDSSSVPASSPSTQDEETSSPSPCLTSSSSLARETADESKPAWSGTKTLAGKERQRLPLAGIACRRRRLRCSGEKPACNRCLKAHRTCEYQDRITKTPDIAKKDLLGIPCT